MPPFLFLIAMEELNHMLKIAKNNGWIKGLSAQTGRGNEFEITHLFYADDALIFCGAKVLQFRHLRAILTNLKPIQVPMSSG